MILQKIRQATETHGYQSDSMNGTKTDALAFLHINLEIFLVEFGRLLMIIGLFPAELSHICQVYCNCKNLIQNLVEVKGQTLIEVTPKN